MADTSPKKKVAAKPKKPAAHPKYSESLGVFSNIEVGHNILQDGLSGRPSSFF
jgi:hypothetical protein